MANLLLALCVVLNSVAQLSFKIGAMSIAKIHKASESKTLTFYCSYLGNFINVYTVAGVFLFCISTVLWIKLLTMVPLNYATLFAGGTIVLTMLLSNIILHEQIPFMRIIGAVTIVAGLCIVIKSY